MEQHEFEALVAKIEGATGEKMETKLKEAFKGLDSQILEAIDKNSVEINKKAEQLEEALKVQGEELADLKEKGKSLEGKSFKDQVKTILNENKDALTALKDGDSKSNIRMTIKAVGDMTLATNTTGQIPQAERESGITRIVRRQPYILELVNVGGINSNLMEWVEQKNAEGAPAMTAEGVLKAQIDFDLVLASAKVEKVTAFVKVSKEMLDDIPLMESEINQELRERINLKIDDQLLNGDGVSPNLTGILTNATAFAAGSFTASVDNANNADVLRVAINQIEVAQFMPNYIIMHPSDVAAMDLEKGTDGHYVLKPFTSADNNVVKGVPIISNTGMTEGSYLVGDFSKSSVRIKESLTFDIGYVNDDFTKNFVTILAEARLVHYVKSNYYPAFVTGVFATDKAALETV